MTIQRSKAAAADRSVTRARAAKSTTRSRTWRSHRTTAIPSGRAPTTGSCTSPATVARAGATSPRTVSSEALVNAIEASPHDPAKAVSRGHALQVQRLHAAHLPDDRLRRNVGAPRRRHRQRSVRPRRARGPPTRGAPLRWDRDRHVTCRSTTARTGSRCSSTSRSHRSPISKCRATTSSAATQGRAFWILDDLSPLQQIDDAAVSGSLHPLPTAARLPPWGLEQPGAAPGSEPAIGRDPRLPLERRRRRSARDRDPGPSR